MRVFLPAAVQALALVLACAPPVAAQDRSPAPDTSAPVVTQSPSRPSEFIQESVLLPVNIGGASFRLETLVLRSRSARGRLPIALITHGKPGPRDDLATIHATNYRSIARDLARRGWLAAVVVRRGYGLSEGALPQFGDCRTGYDLGRLFKSEAMDLAAALTVLANRSDADGTRAIAVGVSAGGAAVTALAAHAPANLKAVVNVSGGLRNEMCPYEDKLVDSFGELGRTARIPSLWVYARNDKLFGPDLVDRMRAGFTAAGGDARLVMTDPVGEDGHQLFSLVEGRTRWYAALDAFLRDVKLPTYGEEEVDGLMALGIEPSLRPSIMRYVAVPGEKALARPVGGGKLNWFLGGSDLPTARRQALEQCEKAGAKCEILAENNRPVQAPERGAAAGGTMPGIDAIKRAVSR